MSDLSVTAKRRAARKQAFVNFVKDFGIYVGCAWGVFISDAVQAYKTKAKYSIKGIDLVWIAVSLTIAVIIVVVTDIDKDDPKAIAGKRKNWGRRLAFALMNGIAWQGIIG